MCIYLAYNANNIYMKGWVRIAPRAATVISVITWLMVIKWRAGARESHYGRHRTVSFSPSLHTIYARRLNGMSVPFLLTAQMHIMGTDAHGDAPSHFADIVLPYTVFGTVIVACGAGIFLDFAMALFGALPGGTERFLLFQRPFRLDFRQSGGECLTTGSVTIPAMKKHGFDPVTAGAVEACASTAGTMTPPIMGTVFLCYGLLPWDKLHRGCHSGVVPILFYYISIMLQLTCTRPKNTLRAFLSPSCPA
jgi:TRAP-type uncharacterized transport system fused permease subunit